MVSIPTCPTSVIQVRILCAVIFFIRPRYLWVVLSRLLLGELWRWKAGRKHGLIVERRAPNPEIQVRILCAFFLQFKKNIKCSKHSICPLLPICYVDIPSFRVFAGFYRESRCKIEVCGPLSVYSSRNRDVFGGNLGNRCWSNEELVYMWDTASCKNSFPPLSWADATEDRCYGSSAHILNRHQLFCRGNL